MCCVCVPGGGGGWASVLMIPQRWRTQPESGEGGGGTHSMKVDSDCGTSGGLPTLHFWDLTTLETGMCLTAALIFGYFF